MLFSYLRFTIRIVARISLDIVIIQVPNTCYPVTCFDTNKNNGKNYMTYSDNTVNNQHRIYKNNINLILQLWTVYDPKYNFQM